MFEHRSQPLLPKAAYLLRVTFHASVAFAIVVGSLAIGIIGYHSLEGLSWIDSTLNAAMILGGMGPVNELHTTRGKLFASCYALFSGVVFLVVAGVLFAPMIHRLLHKFHLETDSEDGAEDKDR
jgi:hypothetical protein